MIRTGMPGAVLELGRLPIGAITAALAHELQIAVEAIESGGAHVRGYLSLQCGLWMIAGPAHRSWHGGLQRLVGGRRWAARCRHRDAGKRDQARGDRGAMPVEHARCLHVDSSERRFVMAPSWAVPTSLGYSGPRRCKLDQGRTQRMRSSLRASRVTGGPLRRSSLAVHHD